LLKPFAGEGKKKCTVETVLKKETVEKKERRDSSGQREKRKKKLREK